MRARLSADTNGKGEREDLTQSLENGKGEV